MKKIIFLIYVFSFLIAGGNTSIFAQCCQPTTPNLVVDGDFESSCNATQPFTSDMTRQCALGTGWQILANQNGVFNIGNGTILPVWTARPYAGTQFFVGDGLWGGPGNPNYNIAWSQQVAVTAGKQYQFSAHYYNEQANDAKIGLGFSNAPGPNHFQTTPTGMSDVLQGAWLNLCTIYTAQNTETINLIIYKFSDNSSSQLNNDFGLDNIEFRETYVLSITDEPDMTICKGASANLISNVLTGSGSYSYLWSTGATTSSITVSPTSSQIYSVVITDLTTGCTQTDYITVNVENLQLDLGPDVKICVTSPTSIGAFPTGGSGNYNYLWTTGATTQGISIDYSHPGTYGVSVTDNTYGCMVSDNLVAADQQCYVGIQYYQNTQSLPAMNAHNIITAGNHVTTTITTGDVVVLNGQNVTFKGGQSIDLESGFSVQPGGNFLGYIEPGCYFDGLSITKAYNDPCNYTLTANTPYGSGSYSYSWNTGATTKSINVSAPSSNTTYTVTVTDLCLGNNASTSYTVESHFVGSPTYTLIPNLVTPNGDGYNDTWILPDGGKTQYAYNSYAFSLYIYNKWGARVWLSSGYKTNGDSFKEGDINWPATGISDDVYFFNLVLYTCPNGMHQYKFWVQVLSGSGNRIGTFNNVIFDSDTSAIGFNSIGMTPGNQLLLFPNPSSGQIDLQVPADMDTYSVAVEDAYGKEIIRKSSGTNNNHLDLEFLQPGAYYVRAYNDKKSYAAKLMIKTGE